MWRMFKVQSEILLKPDHKTKENAQTTSLCARYRSEYLPHYCLEILHFYHNNFHYPFFVWRNFDFTRTGAVVNGVVCELQMLPRAKWLERESERERVSLESTGLTSEEVA